MNIKATSIINAALSDLDSNKEKLLSTDKYSECRHKELLKSYVIDALTDCFHVIKNRERVLQFVKGQINSDSPKTKNRAKEFLKKFYEK